MIAGQGKLALEMLEERPDFDAIAVPVVGGGMIAGMVTAAKAPKPGICLIGVETRMYPSIWVALKGIDATAGGATVAEGITVKVAGKKTLPIVRDDVDTIVRVDEGHLEGAVNAHLTPQKTMAEGAGAAGLAAMFAEPDLFAAGRSGWSCRRRHRSAHPRLDPDAGAGPRGEDRRRSASPFRIAPARLAPSSP